MNLILILGNFNLDFTLYGPALFAATFIDLNSIVFSIKKYLNVKYYG